MWLAEVSAKAKRHNQILFSKDSLLLDNLRHLIGQANRRALTLWALELAEETARELAERYPEALQPREAIAASGAWAAGEIKMPIAKRAILNCHAMAKELADSADIARCHAVGQACSVIHTARHALGYPMYALSAIALELGLDECRKPIEQRVIYYEQRLRYWMEYEKTCQQNWAGFLKK
ncbi:MAG: hypothetical protein J6V25_06640 [Oscillospiraceae bacterium]|nr:hypothetical protein [Oscillospiraceae bacterium]